MTDSRAAIATAQPEILRGEGLPQFEAITPEAVREHIPGLMESLEAELGSLEAQLSERLAKGEPLDWNAVIDPLQRLGERLRWSWGVVSHLNGVCNSPELRDAHASQQAAVVQFGNRAGQSQVIYRALEQLNERRSELDGTQKRILDAELRDMQLRGVGLSGTTKEAFNAASQTLAELSTLFGNQVLDATNNWTLRLTQSDEGGIAPSLLDHWRRSARPAMRQRVGNGPWLLGLDMPRYVPFMKYSRRRDLREQLYKAHVSRASGQDGSELNNWPLIEEILTLRRQQAERLGFANWAELSIASKMADSEQAVEALLEDLRSAAYPIAQQELATLAGCAKAHGAAEADDLQPWDISYWAEILRKESFELDSEALRPWFPLPQVLDGLFALSERLFGIRIEAADGDAPIWHPDVRFFRILEQDTTIAGFYLDPYSRPGSKRGGAWMDECLVRSKREDGSAVLPVAYLICNQSAPVGETPSLMTFDEVETLFHEFGHGLQHMLTSVEHPQAAGINGVEWDAVSYQPVHGELVLRPRHPDGDGPPLQAAPLPRANLPSCLQPALMGIRNAAAGALCPSRSAPAQPVDGRCRHHTGGAAPRDRATPLCWPPSMRTPSSAPSGTSLRGATPRATTPTSGPRCSVPMPTAPLKRWGSITKNRSVKPDVASATRCSASGEAWIPSRSSKPSAVANPAARP